MKNVFELYQYPFCFPYDKESCKTYLSLENGKNCFALVLLFKCSYNHLLKANFVYFISCLTVTMGR